MKAQLADGHAHFVSDYARIVGDDPGKLPQVMGYYGRELTTYAHLAEQYAVCDHWFCSHAGPTIPNRFVTLTGDLNRDDYGWPEVDTPDFRTFTPSETPTLFDHLTERGVSWVYFENRVSLMRAFTRHTFDMTNVRGFLDPVNGFEATAAGRNTLGGSGGLPSVTFIDPAFGDLPAGTLAAQQDNDDAPPSDLIDGQRFIHHIVTTLFDPANNAAWRETMLLVVYDEHGGFDDHVEPAIVSTSLTGQGTGRLGPRVPAFVVSPWTPARQRIEGHLRARLHPGHDPAPLLLTAPTVAGPAGRRGRGPARRALAADAPRAASSSPRHAHPSAGNSPAGATTIPGARTCRRLRCFPRWLDADLGQSPRMTDT